MRERCRKKEAPKVNEEAKTRISHHPPICDDFVYPTPHASHYTFDLCRCCKHLSAIEGFAAVIKRLRCVLSVYRVIIDHSLGGFLG